MIDPTAEIACSAAVIDEKCTYRLTRASLLRVQLLSARMGVLMSTGAPRFWTRLQNPLRTSVSGINSCCCRLLKTSPICRTQTGNPT